MILDAFIEKLQKTKKEKREKKKIRYLYPRGEEYLKNCTHYWTINKKPKIVHEYIVCDKIISSMFHEINPMQELPIYKIYSKCYAQVKTKIKLL